MAKEPKLYYKKNGQQVITLTSQKFPKVYNFLAKNWKDIVEKYKTYRGTDYRERPRRKEVWNRINPLPIKSLVCSLVWSRIGSPALFFSKIFRLSYTSILLSQLVPQLFPQSLIFSSALSL